VLLTVHPFFYGNLIKKEVKHASKDCPFSILIIGRDAISRNIKKWEVLLDAQLTAALLDRLTHKAHILNINGESYRFKQALARQTTD